VWVVETKRKRETEKKRKEDASAHLLLVLGTPATQVGTYLTVIEYLKQK